MEETRIDLPQWEILPDIGLYMDQVITLMEHTFGPFLPGAEITKSMVNNYVKVGLIKRPVGKRYDREHLALLIMIGVLKQALSLECIGQVLAYLCDEGVQKGYLRFAQDVRAISESMGNGEASCAMPQDVQTPQAQAALAGVTAAVYTIHARRRLARLRSEKSDASGSMKRV